MNDCTECRGTRTVLCVLVFLIAAILGAILAIPGALFGQVLSDTIRIEIVGNLNQVVFVANYLTPFNPGDSAVLSASAVDSDGDPVPARFTFFTSDSSALRIEVIDNPDLPSNRADALGIALRKATVEVWVMAEPVGEMRVAFFRDGELEWGRTDVLLPWISPGVWGTVEVQACAYLVDYQEYLLAESPGPPACPSAFPIRQLPRNHVLAQAVSQLDRRVPPWELERLAGMVPKSAH